jgi:type I pantothenate kinase
MLRLFAPAHQRRGALSRCVEMAGSPSPGRATRCGGSGASGRRAVLEARSTSVTPPAQAPLHVSNAPIPPSFSPFIDFHRGEWSALRAATPLPLSEGELAQLRGINERLSLTEVADVYLPLSRLLNLHVGAVQDLHKATATFLGKSSAKVPYVIGIAGSVAVGKSTAARVLQALLARWPNHPKVDLVTTDGFLRPNRMLEARGIMNRKGFPESYDVKRLLQFVADVKSGRDEVSAPVYSHISYDIVPGERQVIRKPDIMIIEGLNVLQGGVATGSQAPQVFVSDFFDFSIYVDADVKHIRTWYVERFLKLRRTAFQEPSAYFHRYAGLSTDEATKVARRIWREINGVNLRQNIMPSRSRARLILEKGAEHTVERISLRKL